MWRIENLERCAVDDDRWRADVVFYKRARSFSDWLFGRPARMKDIRRQQVRSSENHYVWFWFPEMRQFSTRITNPDWDISIELRQMIEEAKEREAFDLATVTIAYPDLR